MQPSRLVGWEDQREDQHLIILSGHRLSWHATHEANRRKTCLLMLIVMRNVSPLW